MESMLDKRAEAVRVGHNELLTFLLTSSQLARIYVYVCMHVCMYVYTYMYVCASVYIYTYTRMRVHVFAFACI